MINVMPLKISDKAPLFGGLTDEGKVFYLADSIGNSNIVLYFYPKDETFGCTREACSFRDDWERIKEAGGVVIGVSSDSVESHRLFKAHHSLPFTLISDENQEIRKKYGVAGSFIQPRVTFVIDGEGVIRYILNSQLDFRKHVRESLRTLRVLTNKSGPSISELE